MAQPKILRGTYFSLGIGDGGSPETFAPLCGVTTRNFTHNRATNDVYTRDCADPEDVPIRNLIVTGESWTLTGNGVLNRENLDTLIAADNSNLTYNWRFWFTEPSGDLVLAGHWQGPGKMTNFQVQSEDANFANISFTIESDGQWTWTQD